MATSKSKAAAQSDEQRALQEAIDALASAFRHRDEKKDALCKIEDALLELDGFLKNAEADLEAEITEVAEGEGEIALLGLSQLAQGLGDIHASRRKRREARQGRQAAHSSGAWLRADRAAL